MTNVSKNEFDKWKSLENCFSILHWSVVIDLNGMIFHEFLESLN